MLPFSRRAFQTALEGQTVYLSNFPRDKPKSGAPTLKRFCPQGKQRRSRTPAAPLAPAGQGSVAQRTPSQAADPCAWACRRLLLLPLQPKRNAAPMPLLVGHGRVCTEPKALESGTAGWTSGPRVAPLAPAEQGIATPALKTLAYRLFFPLCAVLPIFSVQGHAIEPQLHLRSRFCAEGIVGQQGEMTLPCPAGKGALPVCGERRCLPCGQKRFRVARLILVCRGGKLDE